jgi:hypothetical protein
VAARERERQVVQLVIRGLTWGAEWLPHWFGALLALVGILGLAIPVFTTSQTKDIVSLGDV